MTGLIKADLYRILRKRALWILVLIAAAGAVVMAVSQKYRMWNGFAFASQEAVVLNGLATLLIGAAVFVGVYSDEFDSRSMQTAIGRGISRTKVILAKILSCILLSVLLNAVLFLFVLLLSVVMGAHMSAADMKVLVLAAVKAAYCVAGYTPLAAVMIYMTQNKALSVFTQVVLLVLLPGILALLELNLIFSNLHPSRYTLEGFANRGISDLLLTGGGAGTLIFGFVLYILIAFLLSVLVFRRRELDF